jgi:hypothetical protein
MGRSVIAAAGDPELETALHKLVVAPRQHDFADRIRRSIATEHRVDRIPTSLAADILVGPLYMRALISGEPIDDQFIETLVDLVVPPLDIRRPVASPDDVRT